MFTKEMRFQATGRSQSFTEEGRKLPSKKRKIGLEVKGGALRALASLVLALVFCPGMGSRPARQRPLPRFSRNWMGMRFGPSRAGLNPPFFSNRIF